MMDDLKMMKEEEERRKKEEAEALERAKEREIAQTKVVRCTLIHGSRIGFRPSATGYGLGVQEDGTQCIVQRLVGVKYAEQLDPDGPESSPDRRFGPLQLSDRIVKVGETLTPTCESVIDAIKKNGTEPLELTAMRDPNEKVAMAWRRDRLWNYSQRLYWLTAFTLTTTGFTLLCWIVYQISQLETPPPRAYDNEQMDYGGMYGGRMARRMHMAQEL